MRTAILILILAAAGFAQGVVKKPCSSTVTVNCTPQVNASGTFVPPAGSSYTLPAATPSTIGGVKVDIAGHDTAVTKDSSGNLRISNTLLVTIANEGSTGTTQYKLAKLTGAPSTAIIAATSDTNGIIGIVQSATATTGNASIARFGIGPCIFDGATVAGHYVQISATAAGDCHDAGATYPASGQIIGFALSTNGGGGTYNVLIRPDIMPSSGAAAITLSTSSPVTVGTSFSGYYYNNSAGAMTFTLPVITSGLVGMQLCFRNYATRSGALTLQAPSLTYIDNSGANSSVAGTFVSGGALGDSACVVATSTTQYVAYPSTGSWTLN